nr:hypothetical protein [Tanacetum cinerariifolium]
MDFRSFIVGGIDGKFHFEPEGAFAGGEGISPSNRSVNNEAPVINIAPLNSSLPSHVAKKVEDSNDVSLREDIVGEAERLHKSLKVVGKRKQATSPLVKEVCHKLRKTPPQASKVVSDASNPLDVDRDPDIHDSADCHFVVAHVTPPSWKKHLKDISLEKLCDIHDMACMQKAVLDNMLNSRTRQLMSALEKARALYDVIREREVEKDKAYAELERKYNEALQDRG